jgi:hypothetical protein
MSHYEAFTSDTEELLSEVYATYLQFYKMKQEFVKRREAFIKVIGVKGNELQPLVDAEQQTVMQISENEECCEKQNKSSSPLFHKLALATHPDKHPDCNPIYFQQAQKANEQGKLGKLVFLCRFLRIDTPIPFTNDEVIELKEVIKKKKRKIEHYQKTYPWLYANADTEELRKKIMEAFCKVNVS